jgi:hypothetical protein
MISHEELYLLLDTRFTLVSCLAYSSNLKMEATCSSQTFNDIISQKIELFITTSERTSNTLYMIFTYFSLALRRDTIRFRLTLRISMQMAAKTFENCCTKYNYFISAWGKKWLQNFHNCSARPSLFLSEGLRKRLFYNTWSMSVRVLWVTVHYTATLWVSLFLKVLHINYSWKIYSHFPVCRLLCYAHLTPVT